MAKAIDYAPPDFDARAQLLQRLKEAPQEYAEALLDAYDIIWLLHEKGILELVKGALGSGEKVLEILTQALEMKETVRTVRNLVILIKIIGGFDPCLLEAIQSAVTNNIARTHNHEPPSLFKVGRRTASRDSRRALDVLSGVIEAIGQCLIAAEEPTAQNQRRKQKTRHHA